MNLKFICTVAGLSTTASAQSPAAPKASKADVQKVVASIKGNQTKMAPFCSFLKLQEQGDALAKKN